MAKGKKEDGAAKVAAPLTEKTEKAAAKPAFKVISPFADQSDFSKRWVKDDDVSHFEEDRLTRLQSLGLVSKK